MQVCCPQVVPAYGYQSGDASGILWPQLYQSATCPEAIAFLTRSIVRFEPMAPLTQRVARMPINQQRR